MGGYRHESWIDSIVVTVVNERRLVLQLVRKLTLGPRVHAIINPTTPNEDNFTLGTFFNANTS